LFAEFNQMGVYGHTVTESCRCLCVFRAAATAGDIEITTDSGNSTNVRKLKSTNFSLPCKLESAQQEMRASRNFHVAARVEEMKAWSRFGVCYPQRIEIVGVVSPKGLTRATQSCLPSKGLPETSMAAAR
jgi:hypothetical protein